jgi:hypothetical protein
LKKKGRENKVARILERPEWRREDRTKKKRNILFGYASKKSRSNQGGILSEKGVFVIGMEICRTSQQAKKISRGGDVEVGQDGEMWMTQLAWVVRSRS